MSKKSESKRSKVDLEAGGSLDEPAAWKEARAWLADGGAVGEPPVGLAEDVWEALVEALVRHADVARLQRLAEVADKARSRRAKKGLHVLRARGTAVEAAPAVPGSAPSGTAGAPGAGSAVRRAGEEVEEPPSLRTDIDGLGWYMVWYAQPSADGGVDVIIARASDREGLHEARAINVTRKAWRQTTRELTGGADVAVARVPRGRARWLLEEAGRRAESAGRVLPRAYAEIRYKLDTPVEPDRHPALVAHEAAGSPASGRPLDALLELPEASAFFPEPDTLRLLEERLAEVEQSPLLLNPLQRRERIEDELRKGLYGALSGPFRERLIRRLLDTAEVLQVRASHQRGGRDLRGEAALCIEAAQELSAAESPERSRVAGVLLDRLKAMAAPLTEEEAGREQPRDPGSLLFTP